MSLLSSYFLTTHLHIPSHPLNLYVENFFYYEGFNPQHSIDRFVPDGNTEMIIDLTNYPKYIYHNETLSEIQACNHVWVSGVRTESICIPSGRESRMLIVTFKKGLAFPFYPLPLNELADCVVDADLIFGQEIQSLRERLFDVPPNQMFAHVESFLYNMAGDRLNQDIQTQCVQYAIQGILNDPGTTQLEKLSTKIGYSQKHLISLFKKQVGVTPKSYLKIIRFQKALLEIEMSGEISWARVAHESGFYDQSHFIHDFKSFSGYTPEDYLRKKGAFLNYIPVA